MSTPASEAIEDAARLTGARARTVRRWARTQLATVALIALTLALGLAAIWQSTAVNEDATHPPALIRALASVPSDVGDERLLETTFSAAELPTGEKEAVFYRLTLLPGARLPYLVGPLCGCAGHLVTAGAGAEFIEAGSYTLRLEAPMRIERGGASRAVEEIPARSEVSLGPGDTAIYPDYTAPGAISNGGDEPVVVLGVAINSLEGWGGPIPRLPPGVELKVLAYTTSADWRSLPAGPVSVSVWRLMLPEGTSVGPYEATGLEALWIETGEILRSFLRPGETAPRGRPVFHLAETAAPFMSLAPDVRRVVTSDDDQPAVLLVLGIEPAGVWSRALAP